MKVQFRRTFFGPDARRYRPGVEYDVPDSWRGKLPPSAKVIEPEKKAAKAEPVEATTSAAASSASKGATKI